jgi:hypothetical protein
MSEKISEEVKFNCCACKVMKPILEFAKDPTTAKGYKSKCKTCYNKRALEIRNNNRERKKKYRREEKRDKKIREYAKHLSPFEDWKRRCIENLENIGTEKFDELLFENGMKYKAVCYHDKLKRQSGWGKC